MIYFDRISKKFESTEKPILDNLNFSVKEGEFVSIVGPSGAGKTTILRLILGDEYPTAGDVFFRSVNVHNLKDVDLPKYRRQIGTVFQDFKLFEDKTVYENLALIMELDGYDKDEIEEAITETLSIVGLEGYEDRFPSQLSGGEKQRIAFARAIVHNPHMVIADEPTAWLDDDNAQNILDVLKRINDAGVTVIMTTHKKHLVDGMKSKHGRILFLEDGQISGDGTEIKKKKAK